MNAEADPLRRALGALEIRTVDLTGVALELSETFVQGVEPVSSALVTRGRHGVKSAQQLEGTLEAADRREIQLIRYQFDTELTTIDETGLHPDEPGSTWLRLQASFSVEYQAESALDEEAIVAFGQRNVAYHVWPYWRELVQSTVARTRFPVPVRVPHYFASQTFLKPSTGMPGDRADPVEH